VEGGIVRYLTFIVLNYNFINKILSFTVNSDEKIEHPSIYTFLDVINKIQTSTYIKIRNINETAPMSRLEREKSDYLFIYLSIRLELTCK
jgi:hypothetical protein